MPLHCTGQRLFVQLCALDEREHIGAVIHEIPRQIEGVSSVTVVVVDDGSADDTGAVARAAGADEVVRHTQRRGLARAFQTGLDYCLSHGADIVVNIDADGQYRGQDIPALIAPILTGQADIVIGNRQTAQLTHFSPFKRAMQRLGSRVVAMASGLSMPDAVSGFRAYARDAALRLFVTPQFSYTVQTLIQAGKLGMAVTSVPITARETTRPSRLHKGTWNFIWQQAMVLMRTYVTYEPIKTFIGLAIPFLLVGIVLITRVIVIALARGGVFGNVPSLIVGGISLLIALFLIMTGILADRIRENRRMLEEILYRTRRAERPQER
jgi:glycosyltransferase involved in cell wall biosynthesis